MSRREILCAAALVLAGCGDSTGGGATGCASGKYILCEDFESAATGAIPAGWDFPQNSQADASNVRVAEDSYGAGVYEAVVTTLADRGG